MLTYMLIASNETRTSTKMQTQEPPSVPVVRKEEVIYMINYLYLTSTGGTQAS